MIPSNKRASRSRYSSPAQPLELPKRAANETSRSFMQRWLEPSVQSKASFEEAGLMRYGVLETMAPLGTMPKPKKAGNENPPQAVRKIILRPSGTQPVNANPEEDHAAPPPKTRQRASSPPAPSTPPPPASAPAHRRSQAAQDAEDAEYDPKGVSRRRQSRRVSLPAKPRQSTATATTTTTATATATATATTTATATATATADQISNPTTPKPTTPKPARRQEPEDREFADKVVEAAVEEALKHYRYPTAWALRTLYDEKSGDADFVAMVEDVFKQTADADTMEEFSRLVEDKKREGKRDNQGCYYFVPPATNSRFTPHKPKAAPYTKLLLHRADDQSETRAAKKSKTSHGGASETPRSRKMASNNGAKAHGGVRTPSRRRTRRDSGSSESSLSSAMSLSSPEASVDGRSPSLQQGAAKAAAKAAARTTGADDDGAPKSQPITTTRRKSLACNKQAVSDASEPNSPTRPGRTPKAKPGVAAGFELFFPNASKPVSSNNSSNSSSNNSGKKDAGASVIKAHMPVDDDDDDAFWNRRRDAQKVTNSYTSKESSIRNGDEESNETTPARRTRRTRHSLVAPVSTRATRSASKRPINEDGDITVSSPLAFSAHGEGSSTVGSRAATPSTMLRPAKKQRTGLRIKSSPMKKKGGTAAGVPRSMGEAQSVTVSNGATREQGSENDEYCSACGNAGDVVCCDGCPRSFHFECVDMVQADHLPDEWYCNECFVRRYPSRVPVYKGAFASALNNLEKSIPRAFSLPKKVQTRFEGVKAGADGDYEEVTGSRTAKKRPGYDELPDFFKQREDGEAVLCHACQKPATEIRAIIPCSACPFHWHIDCLDPPLAMPPVLKTWRCPAHVDDVLAEAHHLAPAHRFRKVKGGQIITPAVSRGIKNNGHVEIDWAGEPEEPDKSGWRDPDSFGRTYRLPANGVVLDFIEQLRHQGAGYGPRRGESRWIPYPSKSANGASVSLAGSALERQVEEMQVSLNLMGLKQKRSENIDQLTRALLSAADDNVLALMAKGNADNIAAGQLVKEDKVSLRAMLAQMDAMSARIRHVLGEEAPPSASAETTGTPATDSSGVDAFPEKTEQTAPVTEPTPPSTVDHGEGSMELD